MFDYIKGKLTDKNFPFCTVETNGLGYLLLVNTRTINSLPELNSDIKIYTKLIHKEDSMTLCGFKSKQDRIIFDILTSVSGIGTKVALSLLDEFETNELVDAVMNDDHKKISRTKGVGPKMAQKIVLEIKDKLTKTETTSKITTAQSNNNIITNETTTQVITVLESLGYNKSEYNSALQTVVSKAQKDNPEEILKEVLKLLSIF